MAGITTHILDLTQGKPADHVDVALYVFNTDQAVWTCLKKAATNADGRLDSPLLSGEKVKNGKYKLVFAIGDYFRRQEISLPDPPFLEEVPVCFGISDPAAHYHIPLLVSPWGYQVYRGS
ncbi:hydroxyisourate hydrolase [Heyndrickxia coagulans]|uniref:hydroxyisourate hydrolase n=1 Tax=Heyndrickxia coagulans TaxID=1398 RepID=UPI00034B5861|nr:hydroxyisourate hydrolase [Heyndrickxia coagulans]UZH06060.1 hydroxyisourate hydrolase [Heyndrickxia coagulans]